MQLLSADVIARYNRLKGNEVVFVSGSDEHGTPTEVEAVQLGIPPKQLTDKNHAKVVKLLEKWKISFDNYTRTENPIHKETVRNILLKIYKNGYIFTKETEMPYCKNCSRFLPDRYVEGRCPNCGYEKARGDQCEECGRLLEPVKLIDPYCTICKSEPIIKKTVHWYFDLPKFTKQLQEYITNNKQLPDNARNFSINLLNEGLKPRPITRDNKWGIPAPFPGAENKTVYVWAEAVLGYVSATIEYFQKIGKKEYWRKYWFDKDVKTLYFIGKDNIAFHTIIFPALLLATHEDYNLPWNVDSTEFLLLGGRKISRREKIAVWIDEALELFPVDYWRYVLMAIRPEIRDTSFTWKVFIEKVNSDLNDTLGNFIHRTIAFINRHFDNRVPHPELNDNDKSTLKLVEKQVQKITQNLENSKLQAALQNVIGLSRLGNKYLNEREPWNLLKSNPQAAADTLYVAIQIVKALAVTLEPFLPSTAEEIWKLLNLHGSVHKQMWSEATKPLLPGHRINKATLLFHKIKTTERELQQNLERIRARLSSSR